MQVGNFMHYISRFLAGFTIGFVRVWQITLVTLSIVPLIAIAGGLYAWVATGLIARIRKSYVKAGEIAEEVSSVSLSWTYIVIIKMTKTHHIMSPFESIYILIVKMGIILTLLIVHCMCSHHLKTMDIKYEIMSVVYIECERIIIVYILEC